jgi:hypothetical protein
LNTNAVIVFQKSGLADATNDAIFGADRTWVWIGAGRWASGTAWVKKFVVFALRQFRWISE